jgi:hypothetical protein
MTNYSAEDMLSAAFTPLSSMVQSPDLEHPEYGPITAAEILGVAIKGPAKASRPVDSQLGRSLEDAMGITLVPHESVLGLGPIDIPAGTSYLGFHHPTNFTKPYIVIPNGKTMDELREELEPDEYDRLQAYYKELEQRGGEHPTNALFISTSLGWVKNLFESGLEVHYNGKEVPSGDIFALKPGGIVQIDKSLVFARPEPSE